MEWSDYENKDEKVVTASYWRSLGFYEDLETRSGVFIFANSGKQVKYVGKADAGKMILEISNAINRGQDYGATQVKALYTYSDSEASSLEHDLINKYDPINNRM
jgi:excinuclease UvrABC nuclease subunit